MNCEQTADPRVKWRWAFAPLVAPWRHLTRGQRPALGRSGLGSAKSALTGHFSSARRTGGSGRVEVTMFSVSESLVTVASRNGNEVAGFRPLRYLLPLHVTNFAHGARFVTATRVAYQHRTWSSLGQGFGNQTLTRPEQAGSRVSTGSPSGPAEGRPPRSAGPLDTRETGCSP